MQTFDIAIIGGGIAGISLAYFLSAHRSVVVLEREGALGYHSTGRSAAEFTLRDNAPLVNALARASHAFLSAPPEGFADVPLLIARGSILFGAEGKQALVRERYEAAKALGVDVEWLDEATLLARAPILDPAYAAAAYFDPEYWDIEVDALLQAYARHARRNGAQILENRELTSARRVAETWLIETNEETIAAGVLVNAAGGWADAVAEFAGVRPMAIVPHRRTAITVDLPEGIDAARLPEINEIEEIFYFKPEGGRLLASPADATPCAPGGPSSSQTMRIARTRATSSSPRSWPPPSGWRGRCAGRAASSARPCPPSGPTASTSRRWSRSIRTPARRRTR